MTGFSRAGEFPYDLDHTGEEELMMVCQNGAPKDRDFIFFDVGANRGDWTDYFITHAIRPYKGHLFELSETMYERLKENVGHDQNLTINHIALSNVADDLVQYKKYPQAEGVNSLITDTNFWDHQLQSEMGTTTSMTGDGYCAINDIDHIDLLKIDTEGWDWNVIQGFQHMFSTKSIDVVQFEYGYLTTDLHVVMKDFWKLFTDWGYEVGPLSKDGVVFREFSYWDNTFRPDSNYVARLKP